MSRIIADKCKLCRREGMKLFLKGDRCFTEKCAAIVIPERGANCAATVVDNGVCNHALVTGLLDE